jgi:hypothetical protein
MEFDLSPPTSPLVKTERFKKSPIRPSPVPSIPELATPRPTPTPASASLASDPTPMRRDFQSEIISALDAIYDGGRHRVAMKEHEVFNLLSHLHVSRLIQMRCELCSDMCRGAYIVGPRGPNGCHAYLGEKHTSMGVSGTCRILPSTDDDRQMYFTKQVEYITRYIDTYGHVIDRYGARAALKFHFGVSDSSHQAQG